MTKCGNCGAECVEEITAEDGEVHSPDGVLACPGCFMAVEKSKAPEAPKVGGAEATTSFGLPGRKSG